MVVFVLTILALLVFSWLNTWWPYLCYQILEIISGKQPIFHLKDEAYVPRVLIELRKKLEKLILKK